MFDKNIKIDVYQKRFRHFALRLSERYKLFITFEEYLEMHDFQMNNVIRKKVNSFSCVIFYKSIPIKIAKSTNRHENNIIITALCLTYAEYRNIPTNQKN